MFLIWGGMCELLAVCCFVGGGIGGRVNYRVPSFSLVFGVSCLEIFALDLERLLFAERAGHM